MNEDKLNELLERCESSIARELLIQLYPHLLACYTRELRAQYKIDFSQESCSCGVGLCCGLQEVR